jgi:hypothetical protein
MNNKHLKDNTKKSYSSKIKSKLVEEIRSGMHPAGNIRLPDQSCNIGTAGTSKPGC